MASTKQNDVTPVTGTSDNVKAQGLSLSHSKLEPAVTEENDRNSNLSPSKSADPARKKTFKIISVKKGGSGSGDLAGDNDADSIDGLDESQTEDLSSEFYDSSKATDLDMDLQDSINPLTPDEVTSTTTIVVKQKPDQNSQSRFKVVKIETKEPFRRGKWVCYDFFDTAPASVVTLEKNGSKVTEDSIIHSALSGNFSSSSSVHYVQDVNDSSSNIFVTPVVPLSPTGTSDVFVPIQTAPVSQVLGQFDGLSSDVMTPFIAQQVLASVGGVPSSSSSFHASALTGHTTIVQSLPQTNVFPYAQNGPPTSLYQNGVNTGQTTQVITIPNATIIATGAVAPAIVPSSVSTSGGGDDSLRSGQAFVSVGGVPHSQSQIHIGGVGTITPQGTLPILEMSQSATASSTPASKPGTEKNITTSAEGEDQMGPGMDESTGSTKTLQGDSQTPQGLEEAVETMYIGLEGHEGEDVDESGGSTVAIDNKIEQAMDLVKRHLMYAVREEVEILKQQIGEMMERIGQLEYENTVLRSEAMPETLNKLQIPRVAQTPAAGVTGQQASMVVVAQTPQGQQPTSQLPSVTQAAGQIPQQPQQPPQQPPQQQQQQQQQQTQQTPTSQTGQQPST